MTPDFPGTSFMFSAYPTIVALLLFGASVGAALVVLAQEYHARWQRKRSEAYLYDIGFLAAESEGLVNRSEQ